MADNLGRRYSLLYGDRGTPVPSSLRFRKRLSRTQLAIRGLAEVMRQELGVEVDDYDDGELYPSWFEHAEIRDVLDYITLAFEELGPGPIADAFVVRMQRIMDEENIAFRIDAKGGVHPRVDTAFTGAYVAAIDGLQGDRYRNVLAQFEQAEEALSVLRPDPKHAVRSVFNAVEGLFRLMFDRAQRLGSKEIGENLRPALDAAYEGAARRAAGKIERSFGEWVDAAHFYRHEQGQEGPAQPPIELAILLVSEGTAFLRWLAVLDKAAP